MTEPETFAWGGQRYRFGSWHAEDGTAILAPQRGTVAATPVVLRECLERIAAKGYRAVVTSALNEVETPLFVSAGFQPIDELAVLRHDLSNLDAVGTGRGIHHRRGRVEDRPSVLEVDGAAFPTAWHLDESGLIDAMRATTAHRFRVVPSRPKPSSAHTDDPRTALSPAVAYSVSGRTGRSAFLQRLAVHPAVAGRGIGRTLVADCLRWSRRWRATSVMVNTQISNDRALGLYESCGFTRHGPDLHVLRAELT